MRKLSCGWFAGDVTGMKKTDGSKGEGSCISGPPRHPLCHVIEGYPSVSAR